MIPDEDQGIGYRVSGIEFIQCSREQTTKGNVLGMFNPFVTRANGGLHLIVPGLKPVIALLNAFMLQSLFGIGQLTPRAHQFRKTDFCGFFF